MISCIATWRRCERPFKRNAELTQSVLNTEYIGAYSWSVHCTATLSVIVNIVKGGGRAPPTITSLGQFFHHDGMCARKRPLPLCVYSVVLNLVWGAPLPPRQNLPPVWLDRNKSNKMPILSNQFLYSETGLHIGMERNFVGLWRRHNCRSRVIDLSLSALIF